MANPEWTPVWYTIPAFASRRPHCMYHKENEEVPGSEEPLQNLHVLARASIVVSEETPPRCTLRISADDCYRLFLNGQFLGQGPAPAWPEHYYYNTYDLTPYLKKGNNLLAVHLYYQGLVNRVWNSGDGRFAVASQLETDSPDAFSGSLSDSGEILWNFKICHAYSGEPTGYGTQFLENFDSALWEEDWNLETNPETGWSPMVPAAWAYDSLTPQPTQALEFYTLPPARIQKAPGFWILDAGHEITGALLISASGKAGSRVMLRFGEELQEDGHVRWQMRCNCRYEEVWTLREGSCRLHPYDYKGFRYAEILWEEGVEIQEVSFLVRHYPLDDTLCSLQTSNPTLDRIFAICRNGVKYGTQEGYLDCPTREKGQYLGDAIVTGNAQVWLSGSAEQLRKCILQFAYTRRICPGLMAVAPGSFMQEIADFSLLWSQMLMQYYRFTGDLDFLRELYPTAQGIVEYFRQYANEEGLLEQVAEKWNLVDWPENLRDGYDFVLSRPVVSPGIHNVINALFVGAAKTLAELEALLGYPQSCPWQAWRDAYWAAFFRPETGLLADSLTSSHCALHSNLYALYFGLVPKEHQQRIADFLREKGLCCGVFTAYFVLKGLARAGRYDDVYRLIVNESEHGWVNMLREGATSCWEAWGKDQKRNTSLCHPWGSAPISVVIECLAGFSPAPQTPEGFVFEPHIPQEFKTFELTIPFRGKSYKIRKDGETVSCQPIPSGTHHV